MLSVQHARRAGRISFDAVISASEKGGQMFAMMRRAGFSQARLNVIRFNAVISSCEKGRQRRVKL